MFQGIAGRIDRGIRAGLPSEAGSGRERSDARPGGLIAMIFQSKLSAFGYLCVCLNAIFFGYLIITEPSSEQSIYLVEEDSHIENFTAILLSLAGFLLIIIASVERRTFLRYIYFLGGIAFVFASGEEISWGQRIFDFETPEILTILNTQKEFNVHNIVIREQFMVLDIFDAIYIYGTFVLCVITCSAFFCNKDTFLGVPLPTIPLMLSFLVMLSHRHIHVDLYPDFSMEKILLLIFIIHILLSNKILFSNTRLQLSIATMILVLVISYIYQYDGKYVLNEEFREYLFSLCCFFYSLELLCAQGSVRRFLSFRTPKIDFQNYFGYVVLICVIPGSILLTYSKYTRTENILLHHQETLQFLKDANPIIRSSFDIFLKEKSLVYVKDNCSSEDIDVRFFLLIYPIQQSDLPDIRRPYGYDHLNFSFKEKIDGKIDGFFDGQRCIVVRYLPSYGIAKIRTGQFVNERRQIWSETFIF